MRSGILAAIGCLALAVSLACSNNNDNGDGAETATAETTPTSGETGNEGLASITAEDLAVLVLPKAALGTLAEGMSIDPDSGPHDNAAYADGSLDPGDDAATLDAAGRITGYGLDFTVDDAFEAFGAGEGLVRSGSSTELFRSADEASAQIEKRLADFEGQEGKTIEGLKLTDVSRVDVAGIGDEAGGLRFVGVVPGLESGIHATVLFLRMGPFIGSVHLQAATDEDYGAALEDALRALETRVQAFVDGELDETPVPIPTEETGDGTSAPEDVVDVAPAALTLDDLPAGFAVTGEEYATDGDADFTRTFEADGLLTATIGSSEILQLENNVLLFGSTAEASAFVTVVAELLTGEEGEAFFSGVLEDEGLEGDLELETRDVAVGDEGVVIEGTVETSFVNVHIAFMVARQAEGVAALIVTGLPDQFVSDDLVPLLELTMERLTALPRE